MTGAAMLAEMVAEVGEEIDPVAAVRAVLSAPDAQLDYARAKLALDRIIDPSIDVDATLAELDRMTERARRLAGSGADDDHKLAAIRKLVYESGPWNGHRPFAYDHLNFKDLRIKLLPVYLETRLGNCVSMPILFLILADRLGLNIALSMANSHPFLHYRDARGRKINLEATSGAAPARDAWIREILPVSDRAIASGFCMRTLSRREGVALMAVTILEYLREVGRYREAVAACEAILEHNPRCGFTAANMAQAYCHLLHSEFLDKHRSSFLIPMLEKPRYSVLLAHNQAAFGRAEALGWQPFTLRQHH